MLTKKTILILLAIILLGLGLRLLAVFTSESFWFDEIVSLKIAEHSIADSWQYLKFENNPPLHYWFLHFWINLFGQSEVALRLSSVLFGILNIFLFYLFGKRLFDRKVGLIAAFIISLSSYQLFLSMDARMYQMLLAFSLLSVIFFWKSIEKKTVISIFLFIISSVAMLYTHLIGLGVVGAEIIYLFVKLRKHSAFLSLLISLCAIVVLFMPWFLVFFINSLSMLSSSAWYLNTPAGVFLPAEIIFSLLFLAARLKFINLFAWLALIVLLSLSLLKIKNWHSDSKTFSVKLENKNSLLFCLLLAVVPITLGFLVDIWVSKYYLTASIGIYPVIAYGTSKLFTSKTSTGLTILFLAGLFIPYVFWIIENQGAHQWNNVATYIEEIEKADDLILIPAFVYKLPLTHYYSGTSPVIGYEPEGLEGDDLLKTVKYNWYPLISEDNIPDLSGTTSGYERVIVVYPSISAQIHRADLVMQWFRDNNWGLEEQKKFGGFVRPEVYIFSRPGSD